MYLSKACAAIILLCSSALSLCAVAAIDAEWKLTTQLTLPAKATALDYSHDGALIAVGHTDGNVTVWEIKTSRLVTTLKAHSEKVNKVQFNAQGSLLITIGEDKRARLWSTKDWSEKGSVKELGYASAVSADGRLLAGKDSKGNILLWDLSTLKKLKSLTDSANGGINDMSFTADGKHLITADKPSLIINVETKQKQELSAAKDKKTPVKIQQVEKDKFVFSMGKLEDDDAITHRVVASSAGTLVALGRGWYGQPAFVDVWDFGSMKRLGRYKPEGSGTLASFSFDSSLLAIQGAEQATVWNIAQNKQIAAIKSSGLVKFSTTSVELAVTDENKLMVYAPK